MTFFFDVDNTLTRSKTLIEPEIATALQRLINNNMVIFVSGGTYQQIRKQITFANWCLAQNGNYARYYEGMIWENKLPLLEKIYIFFHCAVIRMYVFLMKGIVGKGVWHDKGCQISYSILGHNQPTSIKEKFDPTGRFRRKLVKLFPLKRKTLQVSVGGTTCLDFNLKGQSKGDNVKRFIDMFIKEDCVYIGDALQPGGNDHSVVGVCKTIEVKNPAETLKVIKRYL
jgi:HAD superfamily hydrolase (TIGR01484 family)